MNPQTEQKRKHQIAATFQEHVEVFGFNKTSVDEIAGTLRISKKTIYQLFSSKQDIFNYIVEMKSAGVRKELLDTLSQEYTHRQKVNALVRYYLRDRISWNAKQQSLKARHKADIARAAFQQAFFQILQEIVQDGIKRNIYTVNNAFITLDFIRALLRSAEERLTTEEDPQLERETIVAINRLLGYY
ncbi:MAG: TetR/AcrR family transcriptional regulator [Candidatus Neomarinimicrobiota bacterium]|nr:MAG: TetR/AcrR family transcriptional regulator [Candidatus Neomarinimicrobiota bacterium]